MSFDLHPLLVRSAIAVAPVPAASGTSVTVTTGEGALFPDPGAGGYNATIYPTGQIPLTTNAEIVRITNVAGDVLTITRTQEGSSARTIVVGDIIVVSITPKVITDIETAIPSTAGLISNINLSAGATSANLSKVTFANSNGVSFGLTNSIVTATVKTDYLTTAMQSNAVTLSNIKVSAGTLSALRSDLTFSNSNGLAFGLETNGVVTGSYTVPTVTAGSDTLGMSNLGNTSGTTGVVSGDSVRLLLAGGNNITLSQSINGSSATITISGPNVAGAQTGISGVVVSDATYTSGTVSFSNAGNVTIGSSVDGVTQYIRLSGHPAQTVQSAIKGFGVSDTGETAGDTGISTGIDWVLAGSQSLTLSQSTTAGGPNTVWLQHPAWLTTAMGSNLGSDFVQATAAFNGTNASGTIASDAISVSVNAQTNQSVGLYASSNTYLTSSGTVDARSLTFRGDKSITVGISSGEVVFSVGAYLTTAMASNRASDFVAATAGFNGTNASGTIASNSWSVSVAAQSAQTVGLYASSNTYLTSSGTVDARSLSFRGDKSITVGVSAGEVAFSVGAYLTTAMASNRGSDFVQATAAFNGTNASGTIASDAISVSVAAPIPIATAVNAVASANSTGTVTRYAPEDHRHAGVGGIGISTSGNTAGTTGSQVGTYWIQGGNSITLSQITSNNGSHTLVISAGNYLTTAMASNRGSDFVQATAAFNGTNASGTIASNAVSVSVATPIPIATAVNDVASANSTGTVTRYAPEDHRHAGIGAVGISTSGNTAGTTGSVQGTYWFQGGNKLTVSQITSNNGSHTLVFSAGNYLTTAMASDRGSDFVQATAGFNGTNASGTIASNSISVSVAAPIPIGTAVNAVASVGSTGTITRYAPEDHQHAGVAAFAVTNTGNTAGNTRSQVGTFYLAASGAITASQSTGAAGNDTVWMSVAAQTNQTLGLYMSSNTTSSVSSGTADARSLTFRGVGIASVGYSGGEVVISVPSGGGALTNIRVSAGTTSNLLSDVTFSNSNGISFGINASTVTASANTVGTATTYYPVASANSVGTVTRWAAEDHRHAGIGGAGISTAGNTAGTTGSQVGTYWFQGSNAITVSQITSNNGSHTLVIAGDQTNSVGWLEPYPMTNTAYFAPGAGTWYFAPFIAANVMQGGRINLLFSNTSTAGIAMDITATGFASNTTGTKNQSFTYSLAIALYSQGAGANSTRLDSIWSNSFSFGLSNKVICSVTGGNNSVSVANSHSISYISEIGSDGAYTLNQYAVNSTTNYTATAMDRTVLQSVQSSIRNMLSDMVIQPVGFNTTIQPGAYWLAFAWSTTTASAATNFGGTGGASALIFSQKSMLGISRLLLEASYRNWGSTATTARSHIMPYGLYTAAANMVPPTNVALSSDLSSLGSAWVPYFNYQYQGITK